MRLLSVLLVFLFGTPVLAGSVDSGSAPYERCALCHGLFGNTDRVKFPKLAGQNSAYLEQQISNFLEGRRTNDNGQMATVVTEVDVQEIQEIVAWFQSQMPPEPRDTYSVEGEHLFQSAGCTNCHVEQIGPDSEMPLLFAQHPEYLAKQMREFRDGIRHGDDAGIMQTQLNTFSDTDVEQVSNYLASRDRTK